MTLAPSAVAQRRHILIAGPGRSGTTLLVQLLGALGFDTAAERLSYSAGARAGLETDLLAPGAPRVVKSPALSWQLREMIESGSFDPTRVECLIVPLRPLKDVAASRARTTIRQGDLGADGGLIGIGRPRHQSQLLAELTYGLFETAATYGLPLVVVQFPRLATDPRYAYERLEPVLEGRSFEDFERAWSSVSDPSKVSSGGGEMPRFAELRIAWMRLRRFGRHRAEGARKRVPGARA